MSQYCQEVTHLQLPQIADLDSQLVPKSVRKFISTLNRAHRHLNKNNGFSEKAIVLFNFSYMNRSVTDRHISSSHETERAFLRRSFEIFLRAKIDFIITVAGPEIIPYKRKSISETKKKIKVLSIIVHYENYHSWELE